MAYNVSLRREEKHTKGVGEGNKAGGKGNG